MACVLASQTKLKEAGSFSTANDRACEGSKGACRLSVLTWKKDTPSL